MLEPRERALAEASRVARLATIAADGRPHLVPVCFALIGHEFVIPIDQKPKSGPRLARLRNIERDPRVSLLFDYYHEDWTRLAWLRVDGLARVIERGEHWREGLEALRERYSQYVEMELERLPLIRMGVERAVLWSASPG